MESPSTINTLSNSYSSGTFQDASDLQRPRPSSLLIEPLRTSPTSDSIKEVWKTSSKRSSVQTPLNKEPWRMSSQPRHLRQIHKVLPDPITEAVPLSFVPQNTHGRLLPKPLPQEPVYVMPVDTTSDINHSISTYGIASPYYTSADILQAHEHINNNSHASLYLEHMQMHASTNNTIYPDDNRFSYEAIKLPEPMATFSPAAAALDYPIDYSRKNPDISVEPFYIQHSPRFNSSCIDGYPQPPATTADESTNTPVLEHSTKVDPLSSKVNRKKEIPSSKEPDEKPEKKVRQITVQSINAEHRAWIDILPSETGISLAQKIHILATFRTKKIISITTASNRKIPIDNRLVIGSWMEDEDFIDGEQWSVEWCENDRGALDKLFSKFVQTGVIGKRKLPMLRK